MIHFPPLAKFLHTFLHKYFQFVRQNQDIIRDRIIDELFVERILEDWWTSTLNELHEWLKARFLFYAS